MVPMPPRLNFHPFWYVICSKNNRHGNDTPTRLTVKATH
jgi:hypothetical protein